jgi:galactonate dehydratase
MSLDLRVFTIADRDGHRPALALKGDWIVAAISDGEHVGLGEASHSGDDSACLQRIRSFFDRHVRALEPSLDEIRDLERGAFARADGRVVATAISALDQALYDLTARLQGVPVWRLLSGKPHRDRVPVYVTLNRALGPRDDADYCRAVERVLELGVRRVKVAPFEAVSETGDQLAAARRGLEILCMLRESFPGLGLRVDFHERFTPDSALALLPELEPLGLDWIEAPCPIGAVNAEIRRRTRIPLAAGELDFGPEPFAALCERGWADVVMPDVKHVGGLGPLLGVCDSVRPFGATVSPHNPSGAVSTVASLHAAALAANAGELELALSGEGRLPVNRGLLHDGHLHLPSGPGWGATLADVLPGTACEDAT